MSLPVFQYLSTVLVVAASLTNLCYHNYYFYYDFITCVYRTRREIPLRRSCGNHCFIVFCPLAGGYQWSDEIRCK